MNISQTGKAEALIMSRACSLIFTRASIFALLFLKTCLEKSAVKIFTKYKRSKNKIKKIPELLKIMPIPFFQTASGAPARWRCHAPRFKPSDLPSSRQIIGLAREEGEQIGFLVTDQIGGRYFIGEDYQTTTGQSKGSSESGTRSSSDSDSDSESSKSSEVESVPNEEANQTQGEQEAEWK